MDDPHGANDAPAAPAGAGGAAPLTEPYRRYVGRVYDFALRLVRDRDTAALVIQSTFLRAFEGPPPAAQAQAQQLFAGAHHDVRERLRGRRAAVLEGDDAFAVPDEARLGEGLLASEAALLGRVAWQTARELRLDDYELLDLNVRQGLPPEDIAAAVASRPESVQRRLDGALIDYEQAFSALLLFHAGRRACVDLDFLMADGEWSGRLRKPIMKHLEACQACQRTRARFPSGPDVLAALLPVPLPAGWEDTILDRLLKAAHPGGGVLEAAPPAAMTPVAPAPAAQETPTPVAAVAPPPQRPPVVVLPPQAPSPAPRPSPAAPRPHAAGGIGDWFSGGRAPFIIIGGGLLIVVIFIGGLCGVLALTGGDGGAAKPTPTSSPTISATVTATPTETPAPTGTSPPPATLTPTPVPTGTPVPTSTPVLTPTTAPPTPTFTSTASPGTPGGGGQSQGRGRGSGGRN